MYIYGEEKHTLKIQLNLSCTSGKLVERLIKQQNKVEFK